MYDVVWPQLVALHLGSLHPIEQGLTLLLAFGPFVVLAIVVVLRRRADEAAELAEHQADGTTEQPTGQPTDTEPRVAQRER